MIQVDAAILLGLMGSLHCIGMCGPIALALPLGSRSVAGRLMGVLYYNVGRIITYSLLGVLFGLLGQSVVLAGFQQVLSISIGVFILLMVLIPSKVLHRIAAGAWIVKASGRLHNALGRQFSKHGHASLFVIGLLNGLLPCGLVYMALAGATATGNGFYGALFMAVFGMGTIPLMMSVSLSKNLFSVSFRTRIRKAIPVFVTVMAFLLVVRGLNLGIPYLSPAVEKNHTLNCCAATHCKK